MFGLIFFRIKKKKKETFRIQRTQTPPRLCEWHMDARTQTNKHTHYYTQTHTHRLVLTYAYTYMHTMYYNTLSTLVHVYISLFVFNLDNSSINIILIYRLLMLINFQSQRCYLPIVCLFWLLCCLACQFHLLRSWKDVTSAEYLCIVHFDTEMKYLKWDMRLIWKVREFSKIFLLHKFFA